MKRKWDVLTSEEEEEDQEDRMETMKKTKKDALDLLGKMRTLRGDKGCEALVTIVRPLVKGTGNVHDVFKDVLAIFADDPVFLQGFFKFKPSSLATSVASHVNPDVEKQKIKNTEDIAVNEKTDKFVKKAGGFVDKGGDRVMEKLTREGLRFFENVKKKLECKNSYRTFMKLFFYYGNGKIGKTELEEKIAAMIGNHTDLMDELWRYVTDCKNANVFISKAEEENNVAKLDRPKRRKCNPSYRFLSEGYPVSSAKDRAKQESEVLNDDLASVPSRKSEQYSSKEKQKNRQQEILFRCQDDQHEMDLLVIWFKSAVKYAEEAGKGVDEEKISKGQKTHFLRCVERLYGVHGLEMLEIFDKDRQRTLPVLQKRLKQKLKEIKHWRHDLQKIWDHVRCSTYSKS